MNIPFFRRKDHNMFYFELVKAVKKIIEEGGGGTPGKGIVDIKKTATAGLTDTYTITYTDGTTSNFYVTNGANGANGVSIVSITKTDTEGLVDTYTITYSDGNTSTFTVTNGAKGEDGLDNQHTYSLNEQVVGTWLNGETVYETTIKIDQIPAHTQTETAETVFQYDISALNIQDLIECNAIMTNSANGNMNPIPSFSNTTKFTRLVLNRLQDKLYIASNDNLVTTLYMIIVIRYTKKTTP